MNWISQLALESLLEEVALDYKPGLVCKNSSGSHNDMSYETFVSSINALRPHFINYEVIGKNHQSTPYQLFEKLREEGKYAEQSMFKATNGINTHKGANFIHAILIGAMSYLLKTTNSLDQLQNLMIEMCAHLPSDFSNNTSKTALTHGEMIFKKHQRMGIREEAINGFPILFNFPFSKLDGTDEASYRFLFGSMQQLFDTTIIHRAGLEGLHWTQNISQTLNPKNIKEIFEVINQQFVSRWISPGGSADFLSAALLIYKVRSTLEEESTIWQQ